MMEPNVPEQEMLEVVDENDAVVGLESRERIHRDGLLHREANVLFITPSGELIFQHRSKAKDTYPDKLTCAVGGHVDPGMDYEATALKECLEETGLHLTSDDLVFLGKFRKQNRDSSTGRTNNVFRSYYAYLFTGNVEDLRVEAGRSEGFEAWKIALLPHLSPADAARFSPGQLSPDFLSLVVQAENALGLVK